MGETEHEEHLTAWANRFDAPESELFVKDGDLSGYWVADTRICAVLKETNEEVVENDLRMHHMQKLEGDLGRGDSISKLSVWAAAIRDECPTYEECRAMDLVRKIGPELAVVNVKKTSGGPDAETSELHQFASTYREDLREQIELLDPEIVLGCGKTVDLILMWLFGLRWREQPLNDLKEVPDLRWAHHDDRIWLSLAHPSYPPAPEREYDRLVEGWPRIQIGL